MTSLGLPPAGRAATEAARRTASSPWLDRFARVGLAARGLVYALIALLTAQLAFGDSEGSADQQGAFQALMGNAVGRTLLWLVVVGFVGYALWQLSEAVFGHRGEDGGKRVAKRLQSAAKALLYVGLAVVAARIASGGSGGQGSDSATARLLGVTGGRVLVVLAGLVVIAIAGYLALRGVRTSFEEELDLDELGPRGRSVVVRLGQVGNIARGAVLAVAGLLVLAAAVTYDASKAKGLDAALNELATQPFGRWLLVVVALGLLCFGAFAFTESRYRRL